MPINLLQRVRDAAVVTDKSAQWMLLKKKPCFKNRPTATVYEMNDLGSKLNMEIVTYPSTTMSITLLAPPPMPVL
jgi:hypothetical protein